ncbi:hypothetical protein BDM02DRAFT_3155671 [Thelephora ganbajun]|uniref:Uncharacterized protein n=1 Tax=Thelephora ganbajun TaxID=370292 RepID=A0ACB6ZG35_THEGA|nr:hypothetical protein BDM02DRAFT_3155671 [Thelephora ganbajun]
MATRMLHSTKVTNGEKHHSVDEVHHHEHHNHNHTTHDHVHDHEHEDHNHNHDHSHSHGIFNAFGHTHSREDTSTAGAEKIVEALKGGSVDRGSQITLVGLYANIVLTGAKGVAGWYMNSAALLAEAGHSLSDLLGDFVTLFAWKLSQKPPSQKYPYGFGKFETLGTISISILLTGGALGIGFHSYNLLIDALAPTISTMPPGIIQDVFQTVQNLPVPEIGHAHTHAASGHDVHGHGSILNPNAAWFAAIGVLSKEWLYRVTKKVADEERSSVLLANAIHHRSDAYSSMVALVAILGNWYFPVLPLDPIGGLLVSLVVLRQGIVLFTGAFGELTDRGVSPRTRRILTRALNPLLPAPSTSAESTVDDSHTYSHAHLRSHSHSVSSPSTLLGIHDLRAMRAGATMFVDVVANVSPTMTMRDAAVIERNIAEKLKSVRREISEVRVKFNVVEKEANGTAH